MASVLHVARNHFLPGRQDDIAYCISSMIHAQRSVTNCVDGARVDIVAFVNEGFDLKCNWLCTNIQENLWRISNRKAFPFKKLILFHS